MAARMPTERRNYRHRDVNLDLTPMMNLIAILIPAMLVSVVFIELTTLEANAPSDSGGGDPPQLTVRIEVGAEGYAIRTTEPGAEASVETIGLVERQVPCDRYTDTRPVPRASNLDRPTCARADETLPFLVYDTASLRRKLADLKMRYPHERAYTLSATEGTEYEALVEVMDSVRAWDVDGISRALFDQVTFGVPIGPQG